MTDLEMNSYRLTSLEEPGDERLAQIMREVAQEARQNSAIAAKRVAEGIARARKESDQKVKLFMNELENDAQSS